jgi:hypothetical protein
MMFFGALISEEGRFNDIVIYQMLSLLSDDSGMHDLHHTSPTDYVCTTLPRETSSRPTVGIRNPPSGSFRFPINQFSHSAKP